MCVYFFFITFNISCNLTVLGQNDHGVVEDFCCAAGQVWKWPRNSATLTDQVFTKESEILLGLLETKCVFNAISDPLPSLFDHVGVRLGIVMS